MLSDDSVDAAFAQLTDEKPLIFERLQFLQLPTAAQFRAIPVGSECIIIGGPSDDGMIRGVMTAEQREDFASQAEESHGHLHIILIYVAPESPASTLTPEDADGLETPEQIADAVVQEFGPHVRQFMLDRMSGKPTGTALDLMRMVITAAVNRARKGMARLPF